MDCLILKNNTVKNVINSLDLRKSAEYDSITLEVIFACRELLPAILCKCFNNFINKNVIVPVTKIANPTTADSFSLIAILYIVVKIFERLIHLMTIGLFANINLNFGSRCKCFELYV